jgi:LPS sulfotransferase NodH
MKVLKQPWAIRLKRQALDFGLYGQTDYAKFVVLGRSRVGSNLLRGLLNAHPHVAAFGEIFRADNCLDWDHTGYFQSRAAQALLQQDPVRFLDSKVFGRYPASIRAVGFKLFYYHARDGRKASVWEYLRGRTDLRIIHLKRRNVLRTHLSRQRAAVTDQWVNTSGQPDNAVVVRLNYEECLRDFVQTRAWEEQCDRDFADHPIFQVEYENLVGDYGAETRSLQAFLGLEPCAVTPSTFQQTRQPLSAMIANYAELREKFAGTQWAEFFTG